MTLIQGVVTLLAGLLAGLAVLLIGWHGSLSHDWTVVVIAAIADTLVVFALAAIILVKESHR